MKKKPTRFEWENIQNAKMVVVKSREFYDAISKYEVDEHPIENALLIVEMIRQSFTADNSEQKNFFKCGEPYPFVVVFRHFREAAIQVLKQAARTGGTVDLQSTTAFHLLVSVLNLTLQCNVAIKTSKNYSQLKKRGLDWEEGIQKVRYVVRTEKRATKKKQLQRTIILEWFPSMQSHTFLFASSNRSIQWLSW